MATMVSRLAGQEREGGRKGQARGRIEAGEGKRRQERTREGQEREGDGRRGQERAKEGRRGQTMAEEGRIGQ